MTNRVRDKREVTGNNVFSFGVATWLANAYTSRFKTYFTAIPSSEHKGFWVISNKYDPRVARIAA